MATSSDSFSEWLTIAAGFLFLLAAFVFPMSWWERAPSFCLVRQMFGVRCPGCGMTSAFLDLAHLHFSKAIADNWRVVIAAPVLAGCFARAVWLRGTHLMSAFLWREGG